jgi:hypothetical protein
VCRSRYDIIRETIYANSSLCLHTTGEFGVVYKAQHTEPEGDIGYKTSTVAVKTLKGTLMTNYIGNCLHPNLGVLLR